MSIFYDKNYSEFVRNCTSKHSTNLQEYIERLTELDTKLNVSLFNTGAVGLAGEAGEILEIMKKVNWQEKPFDDKVKAQLLSELGDVAFYFCMLCLALELDLSEIIDHNVEKLSARYPDGFEVQKSENRSNG